MAQLMRRGEVRWYRFDAPNKRRPVLVLTRDSAIQFLHDVTVAPITSTIRDIPTEVALDESNGMPRACAVNLDHVQTVPKDRVGATVTTLDRSTMRDVARALAFALDLGR
jgi:mRNA interferase MazF